MHKNNSSRNRSLASTIQGMKKKRTLKGCSKRNVRRLSSQVPLLSMQKNVDSSKEFSFLETMFSIHISSLAHETNFVLFQ